MDNNNTSIDASNNSINTQLNNSIRYPSENLTRWFSYYSLRDLSGNIINSNMRRDPSGNIINLPYYPIRDPSGNTVNLYNDQPLLDPSGNVINTNELLANYFNIHRTHRSSTYW